MALKQLIALTEIHVTTAPGKAGDRSKGIPPVAPKVKIIPATAQFKAQNEEQQAEFIRIGAARPIDGDDEKARAADLVRITEDSVEPDPAANQPAAGAEPVVADREAGTDETAEANAAEVDNAEDRTETPAEVDGEPVAEKTEVSELDRLRAEYEQVFGEAPNGNMKEAGLKKRIADKREADAAAAKESAEDDDTDGMV